jgi:peptide/nickel transport system permease protein
VAIESYKVVGNIVYVEYNDEPSLKMVKEVDLKSFAGQSSILSVEQDFIKTGLLFRH